MDAKHPHLTREEMNNRTVDLAILEDESITEVNLKLCGYKPTGWQPKEDLRYFQPICNTSYQMKYRPVITQGQGEGKPLKVLKREWCAVPLLGQGEVYPSIKDFKTMGELNWFHRGMTGEWLWIPHTEITLFHRPSEINYNIKMEGNLTSCFLFIPDPNTTSGTICATCGQEKWKHKN